MERIYKIENEWLRAAILVLLVTPVFIRHLWRKGNFCKVVAIALTSFILVKSFHFFKRSEAATYQPEKLNYEIVDLSDAYDSGRQRTRTDYIVIHHTAMMSNLKTSILQIASMHMKERGWSSIAYQYLIMNGTIYKLHSDDDIAPHTEGRNSTTIGICIHGNYSKENLSESDKNKLIWLVRNLQDKYKLDASRVVKHGDLNITQCCGKNIDLNEIRKCLKNY